jgi:hypothetical protein
MSSSYLTKDYAAKRVQTTKNLNTASGVLTSVGGVVAVIPVFPWTQIAGAGIAAVGGALQVANLVRAKEDRILVGDKKALAVYMRKVARWPKSKRAEEAKHLLDRRNALKSKPLTSARRVELATIEMKLSILYQVEGHGRAKPKEPVIPDDPQTIPVVADQQPDIPVVAYVAGGAAVAGVVLYFFERRRHA